MNDSLRQLFEQSPRLYLHLLRWKRRQHWSLSWIVTTDTDVCIEGFPRSANSFALSAFVRSQRVPESLRIATHTHSPAQIIQAVRWHIPTMVCVRQPVDAVCGLLAFGREIAIRDGKTIELVSPDEVIKAAKRWAFFHGQIVSFKNHFFVAPFERIIHDFQTVSTEFVTRFSANFSDYDPEKVRASDLLDESFHVGPNPEREKIKATTRDVIDRTQHHVVWKRCDQLYERLVTP